MKSYKSIICSVAMATLLGGCANEAPFVDPSSSEGMGTLMTRCLAPKLTNTEGIEASTRAVTVPTADDFNVVISRKSKTRSGEPGTGEFKYSELPEVLTLPADDYKVYAYHGKNEPAAWDSPYYYGESEFKIEASKITDDVDPIVAKLSNIRVTISFHASLLSAMSKDSKVIVKVGDQGNLTFTDPVTSSAYFKFVDQSQTLVATFTGTVDGYDVIETKTYDNVAPGNHYKITFKVHGIEDDKPGTVDGSVTVDATVEKVDMNHTLDGEEEVILPDDKRPNQGGETPDDPTPPIGDGEAPQAMVVEPDPEGEFADFTPIDLSKVNEVTDKLYCAWKVISESESGFTGFTVDIISDTLTPEELDGVGLAEHLDLINPEEFKEALEGLGFPTGLGGQKEASFDITGFLSLMSVLGEANHEFKMTVADANGTSVISLRLHTN